eukprot:COSAG05_NODE_1687_length_4280_cov_15.580244_5_plen_97_part_00
MEEEYHHPRPTDRPCHRVSLRVCDRAGVAHTFSSYPKLLLIFWMIWLNRNEITRNYEPHYMQHCDWQCPLSLDLSWMPPAFTWGIQVDYTKLWKCI